MNMKFGFHLRNTHKIANTDINGLNYRIFSNLIPILFTVLEG